jgi:GNAT superfamily N-acetyltransferase
MGRRTGKTNDIYYELYRGHTLLVALAGKQAYADEEYLALMADVAHLVRHKINILLVSSEQLSDMSGSLLDRFGTEINEIVLVNHDGGIRDTRGWIAPLLTQVTLERILNGQHPDFRINAKEKRAQIQLVLFLLPRVGKVSLIGPTGLRSEILHWRGSGTMCVDTSQLSLSPVHESELPIFRDVYEAHVAENKFRRRSEREIQQVGRCHQILRAKNSPIAGFSLLESTPPWLEFCVWWAQFKRDGFGKRVLDAAKQQAEQRGARLFALSTEAEAIESLIRNGFRDRGRVSQLDWSQTDLPPAIRNYDTSTRDPQLLTLDSRAEGQGRIDESIFATDERS